ncbi:MAG: NfeD family protein, partial [Spirochaetales bacterium]|nr:NfeD family protein [Spirochaetales bacterium]
IPGFTIFFFGIGALLTALAALMIPAIAQSYIIQLIIWLTSSILSLVFLRKKFSKTFKGKIHQNQTDSFIGKNATVIDDISDKAPGRISVQGTTWKAESTSGCRFYKNDTVRIAKRKESESLTFIVEKLSDD